MANVSTSVSVSQQNAQIQRNRQMEIIRQIPKLRLLDTFDKLRNSGSFNTVISIKVNRVPGTTVFFRPNTFRELKKKFEETLGQEKVAINNSRSAMFVEDQSQKIWELFNKKSQASSSEGGSGGSDNNRGKLFEVYVDVNNTSILLKEAGFKVLCAQDTAARESGYSGCSSYVLHQEGLPYIGSPQETCLSLSGTNTGTGPGWTSFAKTVDTDYRAFFEMACRMLFRKHKNAKWLHRQLLTKEALRTDFRVHINKDEGDAAGVTFVLNKKFAQQLEVFRDGRGGRSEGYTLSGGMKEIHINEEADRVYFLEKKMNAVEGKGRRSDSRVAINEQNLFEMHFSEGANRPESIILTNAGVQALRKQRETFGVSGLEQPGGYFLQGLRKAVSFRGFHSGAGTSTSGTVTTSSAPVSAGNGGGSGGPLLSEVLRAGSEKPFEEVSNNQLAIDFESNEVPLIASDKLREIYAFLDDQLAKLRNAARDAEIKKLFAIEEVSNSVRASVPVLNELSHPETEELSEIDAFENCQRASDLVRNEGPQTETEELAETDALENNQRASVPVLNEVPQTGTEELSEIDALENNQRASVPVLNEVPDSETEELSEIDAFLDNLAASDPVLGKALPRKRKRSGENPEDDIAGAGEQKKTRTDN